MCLHFVGGTCLHTFMRRVFKFRLKPTKGQESALTAMLKDHCDLYNAALQERRDAYRHSSKTQVRYVDQQAQLKWIRAEDPDQERWSASSQQLTLRRLDAAFQSFFRRIKAGQKPGYPRFRSVSRFESVHFTANHDGWTWNAAPSLRHAHVRFKGVGHVKVIQHRPVLGRIKQGWVKRQGRKWFIFISCDDVPPTPLPATGSVIGLDMAAGDNGFAYTSNRIGSTTPVPTCGQREDLRGQPGGYPAAERLQPTPQGGSATRGNTPSGGPPAEGFRPQDCP